MNTVERVIVGKDVARTGSLSIGTETSSSNIVEGEVCVLNKYGRLLSTGSGVSDSDIIYIAVGTADTMTVTNPSTGTQYTHRILKKSGPIMGKDVKSWLGRAYSAATPKHVYISGFTPSTTYETVLRLIYKDYQVDDMTPGQFVQDYRITAAGATQFANWSRRVAALINNDRNARVTATQGASLTGLHIRAKEKPSQTLNDIDRYFTVDFVTSVYEHAGATGPQAPASLSMTDATAWFPGEGVWQQVRDKEKLAKATDGVVNQTTFPVPSAVSTWATIKDETYDCLVIKHNNMQKTSDMNYDKATNNATYVYIPNNRGNQMTEVLDVLNTYFASVGFDNVTL